MIEVRDLSKRYGEKLAVDHLTFTVRPGMVTGFLGPNGAGKSTAMRMMLGLDRPTTGSVTVNGKAYADHAAPLREVGAILEARAIHTGRSAYLHLLALAQTHGIPRSRVDEVIGLVGLQDVARKRVGVVLARHGSAAGHRGRAARQPADADPGRAVQRPRSRGHPLDPQPAARARRRGQDGTRVIASDERDEHDGRLAGRRGARSPDRRHDGRGLRPSAAGDSVRVRTPDLARLRSIAEEREGVSVAEDEDGDRAALTIQGMSCEAVGELAAANGIVLHELAPEQASLEDAFMRLTMDSVEYHAVPSAQAETVGAAR